MQLIRESIFLSALRSLCVCFAACIGIVIGIVFIVFGFSAFSSGITPPEHAELVVAPDANGKRNLLSEQTPVILRIDFHGVIGQGDLAYEKIQAILNETETSALKKGRIKGILLHMNTPGGYSFDSAAICDAIKDYKEKHNIPVYAFVEDLCASGGMYIASAADKIFTMPYSIVGSVGVIMPTAFNFTGTMERYGVQAVTLSEGKDKDPLNPFRTWKPDEGETLKSVMNVLYGQFVDAVTEARPNLSKEKLVNEYGARVFVAPDAEKIGMIDDSDSSYADTLVALCAASGIDEKEKYQVFKFRIPHSLLEDLTQGSSSILKGQLTHKLQVGNLIDSESQNKLLYLYQP